MKRIFLSLIFIIPISILVWANVNLNPKSIFLDGRCTIENTTITVPLKEGENTLLIGVRFFYGWGIVARLEYLDIIKKAYPLGYAFLKRNQFGQSFLGDVILESPFL